MAPEYYLTNQCSVLNTKTTDATFLMHLSNCKVLSGAALYSNQQDLIYDSKCNYL